MKFKYILFLIIGLLFTNIVYANDISNINMSIYVDNNGDAHIKEKWNVNMSEGTELFKSYYHIQNSEITDFSVKMNDISFNTLDTWNVDTTFEEKKYKAGINYVNDGYELCYGISKYGTNTYEMDYTITNFVVSTSDSDMIYFNLIPDDIFESPDNIYIKIYSDFSYSETIDVWGFGNYGGEAYVYDGYIEMQHEDELDSNEYMTVLVKFPKGTFNTNVTLDEDFNYYYDMAEEGATTYIDESDKFSISEFFVTIIAFIVYSLPFIIVVIAISRANTSGYGTKKLKFNKGIKNVKDVPYFRDIPCNKNIFEAYWIACQFGLVKNKNDFLGAILLKWLKNKNIENVVVNTKKSKNALKFNNSNGLNEKELELYEMMNEASVDGILEDYEFTRWCKSHYSKILKWFNEVIDNTTMEYVSKGLITEDKKVIGTNYVVNDSIHEYGMQMAGLKNFLKDFSNIKDRYPIEVNLWEEYLMYAQIFGIAKEVAKEFKNLYPDIITDDYYNDIIFIHTISYNGVHAATTAEQRAQSYSAGGGGFSSGGGGGGAFGSGGSIGYR